MVCYASRKLTKLICYEFMTILQKHQLIPEHHYSLGF
jgi:hypothetical protein